MEPSSSGGLFKKGRDALFSANTVVSILLDPTIAGAKAEADPAINIALMLNMFTILSRLLYYV
jgi:hypothetical protein